MTTTPPSLWAVLLAAWLRSARQPGEHGRALTVALTLDAPRWAPRAADRDRAVAWHARITAALDALPRSRQGAVAAWAAVAAWTAAEEAGRGAVWGRLASAALPLARSLDDGDEVARAADDLAALGALAWRGGAAPAAHSAAPVWTGATRRRPTPDPSGAAGVG